MPNRKAKDRKWKKSKLNEKWKKEGRTANQHKKWLNKQKETGIKVPVYERR
tara:strand:+ start:69 stop:221 length:153 start_codon:yes stop_codon:yes gene_type:complete